jgi:hypothetical protein
MPGDIKSVSNYEQDFSAWALQQAATLRAAGESVAKGARRRTDLPSIVRNLDWLNLAEEIEALARKDRRELASRIVTIIEHLVKLQHSVAREPRAGWMETIGHARSELEDILRDSPSLRREIEGLIANKGHRAVQLAARSLVEHGEMTEAAAARLSAAYLVDQVIGEWWPESPSATPKRNSSPPAT